MSFFKPATGIYVLGPSSYLPERVISNQDLIDWMEVNIRPSWIEHRTGIYERRWVREDQACSDIAAAAALQLFDDYAIDRQRIAQLVLATISGDYPSPPTGPLVLPRLGLDATGTFDLGAACAGFVSALHVCAGLNFATQQDHLLISADIRSKFLRKKDLATTALFGDGAISCLVSNSPQGADFRFIASEMLADGSLADIISVPAGGSRLPFTENDDESKAYLTMQNGAALFVKAVAMMAEAAERFLGQLEMTLDDIDWIVPHQANLHLVRAVTDRLNAPQEKIVETVQFRGNTSGTSVGVALHQLKSDGRLQAGQNVLLVSAGAGGSSACALLHSC